MTFRSGFGGSGSLIAGARPVASLSRRSIVAKIAQRPAVLNATPALKDVETWSRMRRAKLARVRVLLNSRSAVLRPMVASVRSSLKGFGSFGEGPSADEQILELLRAQQAASTDFHDLTNGEQSDIGVSMLVTRAAEIAADLGIDADRYSLAASSALQNGFWSNMASIPGGRNADTVALLNFGEQVAGLFSAQGANVGQLLGVSQQLRTAFGPAWDSITQVTGNLAGIMEGGVRGVMESVFGEGSNEWLNSDTVGAVVDIATTWSSTNYGSPGSIVSSVGSTVGAIGSLVPPPPGAIVAAVGSAVSIVGTLIQQFSGDPSPPPEVKQCAYATTYQDPDAWAVLRLYLYARGDYPAETSLDRIKAEWDAKFDPQTGEVLVQSPDATGGSRRILDVFDRRVLLDAYEAGAFNDWIWGRQSINGADPINVRGSAWLRGSDGPASRGLYCSLRNNDVVSRAYLSSVTSRAKRFRVYGKEFGSEVNRRTDHGPWAIGWTGKYEQGTDEPFWIRYRAAQIVTAFLGGTAPYGVYSDGVICTGVGGSYQTSPLRINNPIYCILGTEPRWCSNLLMGAPISAHGRYIHDSELMRCYNPAGMFMEHLWIDGGWYRALFPEKLANGRPRIEIGAPTLQAVTGPHGMLSADEFPPTIPFEDFARTVLNDDAQRIAWNVPTSSPEAGLITPTSVPIVARGIVLRLAYDRGKGLSNDINGGMSRGTKIALAALGATAAAGTLGWALSRRGKK